MHPDDPQPLRARIRWDNLARAAAFAALAVTIALWPRLSPREPALPPSQPVPVAPATARPSHTTTPADPDAGQPEGVARSGSRGSASGEDEQPVGRERRGPAGREASPARAGDGAGGSRARRRRGSRQRRNAGPAPRAAPAPPAARPPAPPPAPSRPVPAPQPPPAPVFTPSTPGGDGDAPVLEFQPG